MTTDQDLRIPSPAAPCRHCLLHAADYLVELAVVIVWCAHRKVGSIAMQEGGKWIWTTVGPLEEHEFRGFAVRFPCARRLLDEIEAEALASRSDGVKH